MVTCKRISTCTTRINLNIDQFSDRFDKPKSWFVLEKSVAKSVISSSSQNVCKIIWMSIFIY